jgi:hypothetical protein
MKVQEVKELAKGMGINPGKMKKQELVRTIQEKEGNFPCFQTAGDRCDQESCTWRSDCLDTN